MSGIRRALLVSALAVGAYALARRASRGKLRILRYDGLWTMADTAHRIDQRMTPDQFERRMTRLKRSGYPILGLDDAVDALADDRLPPNAVVITIDGSHAATASHMMPILAGLDLPATAYVASADVSQGQPDIDAVICYLHGRADRSLPAADRLARGMKDLPADARLPALQAYSNRLGVPLDWWEARQFHCMSETDVARCADGGLDVQIAARPPAASPTALRDELQRCVDDLATWTGRPRAAFRHLALPAQSLAPDAASTLAELGIVSAATSDAALTGASACPLPLGRFPDDRSISELEYDAYLSGALDYAVRVRRPNRSGPIPN